MICSSISIFGSKIFSEILNEIKLFSKFTIKEYDDLDLCFEDAEKNSYLVVFFINKIDKSLSNKIKSSNFPLIIISKSQEIKKVSFRFLSDKLNTPFTILEFEKKITSLIAKKEFKENSLIKLNEYTIDKNERKIKKNKLELQLSEKEINFLILFSNNKEPINRNFVLKNVWNYSTETETHTVETHIHRLRKKIFKKFGDNYFIKNNKKGYYI